MSLKTVDIKSEIYKFFLFLPKNEQKKLHIVLDKHLYDLFLGNIDNIEYSLQIVSNLTASLKYINSICKETKIRLGKNIDYEELIVKVSDTIKKVNKTYKNHKVKNDVLDELMVIISYTHLKYKNDKIVNKINEHIKGIHI